MEGWSEGDIFTCGEKHGAYARNSIIRMQREKCRRQRKVILIFFSSIKNNFIEEPH